MRSIIKKAAGLVLALAIVGTFLIATSGSALAGPPPPGHTGHHGEGNNGNNGNGPQGYEGQPGKQNHN